VIELTEGYGYPLRYHGWMQPFPWPTTGSRFYLEQVRGRPFAADEYLRELTAGGAWRHFVVTDRDEWDRQPDLRAALARYGPPREPTPGVLIFDLRPPPGPDGQ
jgi:hypothetical protein